MAYRLKQGVSGSRILKGSEVIVLSDELTQKQLQSLHRTLPSYIEEFDEKLDKVEKEVEAYTKSKRKKRRKKKDAKDNEE